MPRSKRRKPKHTHATMPGRSRGYIDGGVRRSFYDLGKNPMPRKIVNARSASSQHPGGNTRGG